MRRVILFATILGAGAGYLAFGAREGRPNVLLVTIDTLRPDAVGAALGTPALAEFLAQSTRFSRARTVAPMTLPAHASMFTGLFPASHGVHDNVTEPLPADRPFRLLAEELRDAGYDTAAYVACAVLGPGTGIGEGFRVYDCPQRYDQRQGESIPGDQVVQGAIRHIQGARGKPWFVWVHLFDPHAPYVPYAGDDLRPATREEDAPWTRYLGDVRRADAAFARLLAAAGDAVVVVASDHGESFGEHDETSHGPLCYGVTVDTLLAVRGGGFARGAVDQGLRSVADIAPTLKRICGLPRAPSDGRDLRGPPHETLVAESLFASRIHGWGQCFSATDGDFTLVESGPRLELFDRRRDRPETLPIPLAHPAYEKLDRALERYRSGPAVARAGDLVTSIPAYGQARRSSTGYLSRRENAALRDPRPHLASWVRIDEIAWLARLGHERRDPAPLQAALDILADFGRRCPESPLAPLHRASICESMADLTGDEAWLTAAARARVESVEKGYSGDASVRDAVRAAISSGDPDALGGLSRMLRARRLRLEPGLARVLEEAASRAATGPQGWPRLQQYRR